MLVVGIINRCNVYSIGTRTLGVTMQSTLLVLAQNDLGTQEVRNSLMLKKINMCLHRAFDVRNRL